MADHPRKVLRHKIVAMIIAASTQAGSKVYPNRTKPVQKDELPIILVYINNEPTDREKELPYKREPAVIIEALEKNGPTLDDKLDELAKEVEMVFQDDEYLDGETDDFKLTNTSIKLVEEGGTLLGSVALTYDAPYHTRALT